MEDGGCAVDDGELVEACGDAAPLFEVVEAAFDHVAALVIHVVEGGWSATSAASPQAMADLVGGFGDDGDDPAPAQVSADRS